MRLGPKHRDYWQRNLKMTALLLAIWFVVSFVVSYFARDLAVLTVMGFPLGFYMAAQGSLIAFVILIFWFSSRQDAIDREYGVAEDD